MAATIITVRPSRDLLASRSVPDFGNRLILEIAHFLRVLAATHLDAIRRLALHYRLPLMYGSAAIIAVPDVRSVPTESCIHNEEIEPRADLFP